MRTVSSLVCLGVLLTGQAAIVPAPFQTSTKVMNTKMINGRKLPPVTMTMTIPLAGSLQHIHGTVQGLANPTDYRFCVYLESDAHTFNGPKPFETDGSYSPIREDGSYDYVNWWANDVYDPVSPVVFGFIWPNALGNCLATLGGPGSAIPQGMYDNSVAWIRQDRVNTLAIAIDPPAPGMNDAIDLVITGIPAGETAGTYKAVVYARTAGGLIGPLPTCGTTYDLIQDPNIPSQAQLHVRDWSTSGNGALVTTATGFRIGLVPAPFEPAGEQCLLNAANIPVSAPTIVEVEVSRVPSPSPSPSSSPSGSPSSSPTPSGSVSASASPSTSPITMEDIFKGASSGASTQTGMNVWATVFTFCLGALTMLFGNNVLFGSR